MVTIKYKFGDTKGGNTVKDRYRQQQWKNIKKNGPQYTTIKL